MKKLYKLFLLFLLIIASVSCNNGLKKSNEPDSQANFVLKISGYGTGFEKSARNITSFSSYDVNSSDIIWTVKFYTYGDEEFVEFTDFEDFGDGAYYLPVGSYLVTVSSKVNEEGITLTEEELLSESPSHEPYGEAESLFHELYGESEITIVENPGDDENQVTIPVGLKKTPEGSGIFYFEDLTIPVSYIGREISEDDYFTATLINARTYDVISLDLKDFHTENDGNLIINNKLAEDTVIPSGYYYLTLKYVTADNFEKTIGFTDNLVEISDNEKVIVYYLELKSSNKDRIYYATSDTGAAGNGLTVLSKIEINNLLDVLEADDSWDSVKIYVSDTTSELPINVAGAGFSNIDRPVTVEVLHGDSFSSFTFYDQEIKEVEGDFVTLCFTGAQEVRVAGSAIMNIEKLILKDGASLNVTDVDLSEELIIYVSLDSDYYELNDNYEGPVFATVEYAAGSEKVHFVDSSYSSDTTIKEIAGATKFCITEKKSFNGTIVKNSMENYQINVAYNGNTLKDGAKVYLSNYNFVFNLLDGEGEIVGPDDLADCSVTWYLNGIELNEAGFNPVTADFYFNYEQKNHVSCIIEQNDRFAKSLSFDFEFKKPMVTKNVLWSVDEYNNESSYHILSRDAIADTEPYSFEADDFVLDKNGNVYIVKGSVLSTVKSDGDNYITEQIYDFASYTDYTLGTVFKPYYDMENDILYVMGFVTEDDDEYYMLFKFTGPVTSERTPDMAYKSSFTATADASVQYVVYEDKLWILDNSSQYSQYIYRYSLTAGEEGKGSFVYSNKEYTFLSNYSYYEDGSTSITRMNNVKNIRVTDMQIIDGILYILYDAITKPPVDYNASSVLSSRGGVFKYNLYTEGNTIMFEIDWNSPTDNYLRESINFWAQNSQNLEFKNGGSSGFSVKIFQPATEDSPMMFGPKKIIGYNKDKILIADEGFFGSVDETEGTLAIKEIDRVLELDLTTEQVSVISVDYDFSNSYVDPDGTYYSLIY